MVIFLSNRLFNGAKNHGKLRLELRHCSEWECGLPVATRSHGAHRRDNDRRTMTMTTGSLRSPNSASGITGSKPIAQRLPERPQSRFLSATLIPMISTLYRILGLKSQSKTITSLPGSGSPTREVTGVYFRRNAVVR